jgi:hypothetical protein
MPKLKCGDAGDLTSYVITGKKAMLEKLKQTGKDSRDLMAIPSMPQYRTIRRIVGESDFKAVDGETYPCSIGTVGDFRPSGVGKHYEIPYTSLYNKSFENLLAAGRIISAPEGDGWEVARVIPSCALTGQAAGTAAALCVQNHKGIGEIDIQKLRGLLQ